jgi:hypothetical protein
MPIEQLPIFAYYNRQRFTQMGCMDSANFYGIKVQDTKSGQALYPTMGRRHVSFLNQNRLIFNSEPRTIYKTIDYTYIIDGTAVYQVNAFFNTRFIGSVSLSGRVWFAYLPVGDLVYALLTDEENIYVITENGTNVTYEAITDPNAPGGSSTGGKPQYVAAFGNRFTVTVKGTPDYYLTRINLFADGGDLSNCFTINGSPLFNRASGVIQQFAVLHSQLYIFNNFSCDIWANIITQITVAGVTKEFPWKINTSYNWDYGLADPLSLSVDFGRMVWLARNSNGLVSFMASTGQAVVDISSQAINVLLENSAGTDIELLSPFLLGNVNGFLYQYENTIFYRVSAGVYKGNQILDLDDNAASLEYNFETQTWGRVIELNGERCRIQKHVYFSNRHLVTVQGDPAIYEMAGNLYYNELRNPDQPNEQAANAFNKYPFRYELVTQQIYQPDYSEFIDDYVQIDFVFGDKTFYKSCSPYINTVYIVDEASTTQNPIYLVTENDEFIIAENSNTPVFDDSHYCALFKPHIELYYSDDGGVTFLSADVREFSPLGQYRWLMRWYELGTSRNRCYKLVCVSSAPIVILGGVRNTRRASGGAN